MNQEHEIVLYQVEDTNIYVNVNIGVQGVQTR